MTAHEKEDVLRLLNYWIGLTECDCNSPLPIGSCLRCDLEYIKEAIENED